MSRRGILMEQIDRLGAALFRLTGFSMGLGPKDIRLERVTVTIPDLPAQLEGFTIGVLSDLHLGPFVAPQFVRDAAERLAAEKPDVVVLPGDLVSEEPAVALLGEALAPLGRPYAAPGNWDTYTGIAGFTRAVRWLTCRGVEAAPGLWLCGVNDLREPGDIERAVAGAPPGAVRILLAHRPDHADRVKPHHRIALQISGHSHGGQVRIPGWRPLLLPRGGRTYVAGLAQAPATQVYTSRGLGAVHLPIRWNCPPEIAILTLVGTAVRP